MKNFVYKKMSTYLSILIQLLIGTLKNGLFAQSPRCSKNFILGISVIYLRQNFPRALILNENSHFSRLPYETVVLYRCLSNSRRNRPLLSSSVIGWVKVSLACVPGLALASSSPFSLWMVLILSLFVHRPRPMYSSISPW
jgi:hypothetical protein